MFNKLKKWFSQENEEKLSTGYDYIDPITKAAIESGFNSDTSMQKDTEVLERVLILRHGLWLFPHRCTSLAEKQYEFEAVDIFPKTSMAFEPIILYTTIYKIQKIQVQIFHTHFSFDYLFQIPPPLEKGWRFSFLVAGQNFPPIPFDLTLECLWLEISGNPAILIQVNECLIEVYKLGSRNIADPKTYEAADQECLKQRKGPTKIDIPI